MGGGVDDYQRWCEHNNIIITWSITKHISFMFLTIFNFCCYETRNQIVSPTLVQLLLLKLSLLDLPGLNLIASENQLSFALFSASRASGYHYERQQCRRVFQFFLIKMASPYSCLRLKCEAFHVLRNDYFLLLLNRATGNEVLKLVIVYLMSLWRHIQCEIPSLTCLYVK